MNRRSFLRIGVSLAVTSLAGCSDALSPPNLRIRNYSRQKVTLHVKITQGDVSVFSETFAVDASISEIEQLTVDEVYPSSGTYLIHAAIEDGSKKTEDVTLDDKDGMTHIDVEEDGSLEIGRIVPDILAGQLYQRVRSTIG